MVVSGFAQIQAQLQYRASGCSIGLPVVVGTGRGGVLVDPTWRIMGLSKSGYKYLNWGYK